MVRPCAAALDAPPWPSLVPSVPSRIRDQRPKLIYQTDKAKSKVRRHAVESAAPDFAAQENRLPDHDSADPSATA
jgi:hypothetical protein